jgi:hypothetical protein
MHILYKNFHLNNILLSMKRKRYREQDMIHSLTGIVYSTMNLMIFYTQFDIIWLQFDLNMF